jgi:ABC-2 type transport system ATP-binding protein
MQQKVQFVSCVLHEPDLIILDEPFSGLDPVNGRLLRDLIREQHGAGRTVIFSTHAMVQAEQLCDRIVMIHQGKKVLDDPLGAIRSRHAPRGVWFEPLEAGRRGEASEAVARSAVVSGVREVDGRLEAVLREGVEPGVGVREVAAAFSMGRVELHRPSLEDVFVNIVTGVDGGVSGGEREALRAALRANLALEVES